MPQHLLLTTKLHLNSSWACRDRWDPWVNFLDPEMQGREDPEQIKLEKLLWKAFQRGTGWSQAKGFRWHAVVKHSLTWNGTLKVHIWSWMFIVSKVNPGGGRGTVSYRDSSATGEDRISSTEGLRSRNWYGCQITLESVLSLKALWGDSQSCLPGNTFWILACYFAILRNWNVSKSVRKTTF